MDARDRFRRRLAAGPVLADGGFGTLLFSRGVPQRACLDELPTTRPDLVGAIHREYLEADVVPGQIFYVTRGGVEIARNVGRRTYHEIIVELKD